MAKGFYKNNAMCDFAHKNRPNTFYSAIGNLWILLYGNKNDKNPKLIALVSEVNNNEDYNSNHPLPNENDALQVANMLKEIYNEHLPFLSFRYKKGSFSSCKNLYGEDISLEQLYSFYKKVGLDIIDKKTNKGVNQYTSSDFHDWQRTNLGNNIIATDFDLIGLNDEKKPEVIYELKRSTFTVRTWNPFPDDFNNFELLFNFCSKADIDFILIFNHYEKHPDGTQSDDLSLLGVYFFVRDGVYFSYKKLGECSNKYLLDKQVLYKYRIVHKKCPYCGAQLSLRKGKYNKSDFYACPNYNISCKGFICSINEVDSRL